MKKYISIILTFSMIVCMFGCSEKDINPYYVYDCLKTQVSYESDLSDESKLANYLFYGISEECSVIMHRAKDAHFIDEIAVIICPDESQVQSVNEAIKTHIDEIYNDYSKYNPAELVKIDNAIVKTYKNYVFLCITADYNNARKVLENAINNSPTSYESSSYNENNKDNSLIENVSSKITDNSSEELVQTHPQYPSIISKSGEVITYQNGVMRVDNSAFEPYAYFHSVSKNYADIVNYVQRQLDGVCDVYAIPIPNAYGIVFPDDVRKKVNYNSQNDAIDNLKKLFNENIKVVDCYDNLMKHRNEYIYFRTDHHWTQLGAYYAYESFCEVKNVNYFPLEGRKISEFSGFLGSLYRNSSGKDPMLGNTPDTVIAYHPVSEDAKMKFTDTNGVVYNWDIIHDVTNYPVSEKYSTFAASDSPYAVFNNPQVTDGSSCIIIKESYGNAFVPFLVDHYSTIYEIDYRYWNGNIIDFAKEMQVNDVIFVNNLSMIGSNYLIAKMSALI